MKLHCPHCGNEWEYGGSAEFYATCTRCLRKVKISGNQVKQEIPN